MDICESQASLKIKIPENMLRELYVDADDYIKLWKQNDLINTFSERQLPCPDKSFMDFKNNLEQVKQTSFYKWINNQVGFKKAKQRLVKQEFIPSYINNFPVNNKLYYLLEYSLEFIIANSICNCIGGGGNLSKTIFIPEEWKKIINKYEVELTCMSRNFELEAEEQLFLVLLRRLKNSKGSTYNSGKPHNLQIRELLTKRIIQGMFFIFNIDEMTSNLAADVALDIVGIFYDLVMKKDAAVKLANNIKQNVVKNSEFMNSSVSDLLKMPYV